MYALPCGFNHQGVHHAAGGFGAFPVPQLKRQFIHETSRSVFHGDETLQFQVSVCLHDRGGIHPHIGRETSHGGKGVPRFQFAGGHGQSNTRSDLLVEWCRASGVECVEHPWGSWKSVPLYQYTNTVVQQRGVCQEKPQGGMVRSFTRWCRVDLGHFPTRLSDGTLSCLRISRLRRSVRLFSSCPSRALFRRRLRF